MPWSALFQYAGWSYRIQYQCFEAQTEALKVKKIRYSQWWQHLHGKVTAGWEGESPSTQETVFHKIQAELREGEDWTVQLKELLQIVVLYWCRMLSSLKSDVTTNQIHHQEILQPKHSNTRDTTLQALGCMRLILNHLCKALYIGEFIQGFHEDSLKQDQLWPSLWNSNWNLIFSSVKTLQLWFIIM